MRKALLVFIAVAVYLVLTLFTGVFASLPKARASTPGLTHFAVVGISTPTAGTAMTGITITAQDNNNSTVGSFTGTVNYSGTAGITGTSASFSAGVLSDVSVTPIHAGTNMTWIVTDPMSSVASMATFDVGKADSTITVTGTTSFTYTGSYQGPATSIKTGSMGSRYL